MLLACGHMVTCLGIITRHVHRHTHTHTHTQDIHRINPCAQGLKHGEWARGQLGFTSREGLAPTGNTHNHTLRTGHPHTSQSCTPDIQQNRKGDMQGHSTRGHLSTKHLRVHAATHRELAPGHRHSRLSVQPTVHCLEGPSSNFNVKLEKPSCWR